jgi:hypothetical protein
MTCARVCRPCASCHHLIQAPKKSHLSKPDSGASVFKVQHSNFTGLSAALLIAGALAPMAGRLVDTHGGWAGRDWDRYGLWPV